MPTRDIFEAIAAITYPMPNDKRFAAANEHLSPSDMDAVLNDSKWEATHDRERMVAELHEQAEMAAEHDQEFDPLLDQIESCQAEIRRLERRVRLLITYAREFVRPQPYQLKDLAHAAAMSISGVRIAYDEEEISEVAELTGDKPRRPQPPATS